ncbi:MULTISPECIES: hypothetical protein [Pseudomonas]|uniref:Uncharacterized protein n=1 Tax=Pseudomonas eucalypticola TaxID=2599595 RepID=A0A7D5H2G3_9PSED|nr:MULTISPECIES: hypothetical protein [Pseudomonas]QKZ03842.1 hypothetical protein HWQ56_08620 [Pseudomonas eucalypticola]
MDSSLLSGEKNVAWAGQAMLSGHKGTFENDGEPAAFSFDPIFQRLTAKPGSHRRW